MSDYKFNEWQTENSQRDYPLENNSEVDRHLILDAVFFIESPITLTKIGVSPLGNFVEIHIVTPRGPVIFRNHRDPSIRKYHTFTEFGKIVWGDFSFFDNQPPGFFLNYNNVPFLESVIYPTRDLQIQSIAGKVNILQGEGSTVVTTVDENEVFINLDETRDFEFTGISTVNNEEPTGQNLIIEGDNCTEVTGVTGLVALNDVCLPPCFQCDERLTTGDVKLSIDQFEANLAALEAQLGITP